MKAWKRCYYVLKRTGTLKIFISFLMFLCGAAAVLTVLEPGINTLGDGLWYCFVASTTIGFGDICAVTRGGRIVTVLVAAYGILMTAMVPGVVVSYYMEYLKVREISGVKKKNFQAIIPYLIKYTEADVFDCIMKLIGY